MPFSGIGSPLSLHASAICGGWSPRPVSCPRWDTVPGRLPRVNFLSQDFVPLNAMRFLLAMYGMLKYSPRSDSWVRGTLLQGAPTIEEYETGRGMESMFPLAPRV